MRLRLAPVLFLLAVAALPGQTTSSEPEIVSHQAPATFSSRVNLVSVPVVIRDKDGHSVGGLQQDDFRLFDKGHAQIITKFTIETTPGSSPKPAAAVRAAAPVSAPQPEAPSKPELPGRFIAYFFDDIHTKPSNLLEVRKAALKQMERTLDANTRAGLFTTSGRVTQDFTSDIAKLRAALNSIQPWTTGPDASRDCPPITYYQADVTINRELSISLRGINASSSLAVALADLATQCLPMGSDVAKALFMAGLTVLDYGKNETATSLFSIQDLIRRMSVMPGARTVVMVSPGFIMSGSENRLRENDIFDQAIHAGVTINTLDVRGLYVPPGFDASEKGNGSSGADAGAFMHAANDEASETSDLLAELAYGTGGAFFHNDNGLEEGLDELATRPEYVYVLGFSPDDLKLDGSYHKLKVTLRNGEHLTVEARRGYWAPNHRVSDAEQAREDIQDAVFSRNLVLDIPIKLHTEFFKQSDTKVQLSAETHVEVGALKFNRTNDRNRDTLVVVTGLFDDNGRYMKGTEHRLDMQLRDQTLAAAKNSGLTVKDDFEVPPGRYVVRVVVRDSEGHSVATQNEGVEIP